MARLADEQDEQTFEVIPAGEYLSRVIEATLKSTKTVGDPMWSLRYEILESVEPEGEGFLGATIYDNLLPERKSTKWKAVKFAKCILSHETEFDEITVEMFVGKELMITVANKDEKNPLTSNIEAKHYITGYRAVVKVDAEGNEIDPF